MCGSRVSFGKEDPDVEQVGPPGELQVLTDSAELTSAPERPGSAPSD